MSTKDSEKVPTFKSIFLGPIIVTVILTIVFFVIEVMDPLHIDAALYNTGLACIASVFAITLTFMAGGRATLVEGVDFNGFYFASLPTAIFLSLVLLAIVKPFMQ